ncbi:MAG TPA: hypothetical protein VKB43_08620 [Gaiellaceae bacterium]|nr:hypothetical protein [Gaiellaceae bacterium]
MKWRVALTLAVVLLGVAAVTAACGGSSRLTCRVYDQRSANYFSATGPGSEQKEQAACLGISRALSTAFGHKWSETKNPKIDYGRAVRVCRGSGQGGEVDLYGSGFGTVGRQICKSLSDHGFH